MGEEKIVMARRRRKPSFFKPLMEDFSKNLKIPPAFYIHFNGKWPRWSVLRTPAASWNVYVEKIKDGFFFQRGWKKFVHDNGLKLCEFLVFRYAGNSKFDVDIYGRSGCKKEFANDKSLQEGRGNAIHGKQNVDYQASCAMKNEVIVIESDTSMPIDEPETQEDQHCKDSVIGLSGELGSTKHLSPKTQVENPSEAGLTRALEAANKYSSKHPSFRVVMQKAYLNKGSLLIPKSFVRSYIGKKTRIGLQDSKRRWLVKCVHYSDSSRLSAGWCPFVRNHALKVGDVCVFELIKRDDVVMKVSIFRCSS